MSQPIRIVHAAAQIIITLILTLMPLKTWFDHLAFSKSQGKF